MQQIVTHLILRPELLTAEYHKIKAKYIFIANRDVLLHAFELSFNSCANKGERANYMSVVIVPQQII